MEKVIVKVIKAGKVIKEYVYSNDSEDKYFACVKSQLSKGYSCLVLKLMNDKCWCKLRFIPPETM